MTDCQTSGAGVPHRTFTIAWDRLALLGICGVFWVALALFIH